MFTHLKLRHTLLLSIFVFISLRSFSQTKVQEELIQMRLSALKSPIDFSYHPKVKVFIDEYLANPEQIKHLVARSKMYFPMIEKQLRLKGVPTDLKYLAVSVSLLDPAVTSQNGASGLWMMMYHVSKMYKMKVNTYVDERRDPIASSIVAAQHFKDLNSIYKSWPLVISAYGCSPVNLNKAIHAAGNSLYFWDIYNMMPSFCRDLYPRVVATAYILNYYKEHGIKLTESAKLPETDTVLVQKWLSFQQISAAIDVPVESLRALNPIFRKDIIPFIPEGYALLIPKGKAAKFYLLQDTVYKPTYVVDVPPVEIQKESPESEAAAQKDEREEEEKLALVTYVIKRGDVLGEIADWFDVSTTEIKNWNHLHSNQVKLGFKLKIYVPTGKTGYYKRMNKLSPAQKNKLQKKD